MIVKVEGVEIDTEHTADQIDKQFKVHSEYNSCSTSIFTKYLLLSPTKNKFIYVYFDENADKYSLPKTIELHDIPSNRCWLSGDEKEDEVIWKRPKIKRKWFWQ